jgi:PAS domain S-box-containing protein
MPIIHHQLFADSPILRVRDVELFAADDVHTHREKLARIVLDEMYQFVGLHDVNGNTLEINRAALEGAGIQLDDVQGKPSWEARWWLVSKETQEYQRELVRRAGEGEFVRCDMEIYGQAAGEQTIIIDYSLSPIRDQNGKIVFLLAEGRNITEKKQAEAEIARKNAELEGLLDKIRRLDRIKSDFFANISHELRTPLALILGPAQSILGASNLTELQRRDLGVIHRNAATLLKHVNDLLDLSKLDEGKQTVNYARVDLAQDTRTIAAHFDSVASERSQSFVIATPESLLAEVDPEKFDRILLNLLSNAFKFTPAGGRIRCALEVIGPDRIVLSVQDSGPGVEPGMRDAIFERFRQGQSGMTRQFGGTGLGMAIVKDFVELHAGTITVSDAPGGGALFQVDLPLCAPEGALIRSAPKASSSRASSAIVASALEELWPAETTPSVDQASTGQPVVMVAEDNAEMRRFVSEVLGDLYRIVPCADGAEALAKAIAEPPDLLVTDLMMPKLGGGRLVEEMRRLESLAHVPILVLSATADEGLRVKLLAESVQDYVIKPFSAQELRARVRNLVVMKRSRDLLQKELASQSEDLSELAQQLVASRQELQRSLDALRATEVRWHSIFENSAVGIALTDATDVFVAANRAYQEMVGYTEQELQHMSYMDITYEEDRPANRGLASDLWEGQLNPFRYEKRYRRKDGKLIWVRTTASIVPGTESAPRFAMAVVEDTTERKLAEERLREYEKAVEGLEEMIVVVDRDYRYLVANRAWLNNRGLEREQVVGRRMPELLDRDVFENVTKKKLDECFEGKVVKYELRYKYPKVGERDLLISYFPIEGLGGVDRAACVLQDITERKRAEARLNGSFSQLRALAARLQSVREDERTKVAREIHDELGQGLTAIKIELSSLLFEWPAEHRPSKRVESITRLVEQTIQSVRRISTELRPGILDALGLVAAVEWAAEEFETRTGIRCRLDLPKDSLEISQDRATAIFRIFQETLTNIARHADATEVNIRLAREDSSLILEVHDNGVGVSEEQLSASQSLGILGMRERALLLGGEVQISGVPNQGTRVRVRIPLSFRHIKQGAGQAG